MDKIIGAIPKAVSKMNKKDDEEKDGGDGDPNPTPVTPSVTNEAPPPRAAPFATP
jgi:hypothetical protein